MAKLEEAQVTGAEPPPPAARQPWEASAVGKRAANVSRWEVEVTESMILPGRTNPEPVSRLYTVSARTQGQAVKAVVDAGHPGKVVGVRRADIASELLGRPLLVPAARQSVPPEVLANYPDLAAKAAAAGEAGAQQSANLGSASAEMLEWQYRQILGDLGHIQRHAADPSCPCMLQDIGEYCLAKHTLDLAALASETLAMAPETERPLIAELQEQATEWHEKVKQQMCSPPVETEPLLEWSRAARKRIEPLYYACQIAHSHGKIEEAPAPPPQRDTCADLQKARRIHARFLHEPEDPKTGSHQWHRRWIRVYRDTERALACAPPPPCPGLLGAGRSIVAVKR